MHSRFYAVFVVLAATALGACGQQDSEIAPEAQPAFVQTLAVSKTTGYDSVSSYSGRVEATLDSSLGFEIGGLVTDLYADEGDRVSRGDALARLDTARLVAQRVEASAGLARIEAELALAKATLERVSDAFSYKGVSRQQLDEAQQRVNTLLASRDVASANVDRIDVDISKSELQAPFDGTVTRRHVDPGVVVSAGTTLLQLQGTNGLEARIGITPVAANTMQVGDTYELVINTAPVAATLRAVIDKRDARTRTVDALFVIASDTTSIRPGDTASLDKRVWNETPGFWLPISSLVEGSRGLWQALVADDDGDSGYVLTGHVLEVLYADSEQAFVRGTLQDGDLIVSTGTQRVVAGQSVRIQESGQVERVAVAGGDDVN